MSKSILQIIQSCSVQKTASKNTKYSRNETILKIGHHLQRLQPMQSPHFGSKIKIPKNMLKSILQIIQSCSVQKTTSRNTKSSRRQTILKINHHQCKGYSPCKILTLAQKLKSQKHVKIHSTNHLQLFCAKNHCNKH